MRRSTRPVLLARSAGLRSESVVGVQIGASFRQAFSPTRGGSIVGAQRKDTLSQFDAASRLVFSESPVAWQRAAERALTGNEAAAPFCDYSIPLIRYSFPILAGKDRQTHAIITSRIEPSCGGSTLNAWVSCESLLEGRLNSESHNGFFAGAPQHDVKAAC